LIGPVTRIMSGRVNTCCT